MNSRLSFVILLALRLAPTCLLRLWPMMGDLRTSSRVGEEREIERERGDGREGEEDRRV